jgi:hypothetical protein
MSSLLTTINNVNIASPAFAGAGLSQDVYLNSATPLSVIGSGGGGGGGSTAISTLEFFVSTVKPAAGLNRIDFIGDPAASLLRLNFSTVNMNTLLGNTSQFNSVQSPPTNNLAFNSDANVNISSVNLVARTSQTVVLSTLSLVMNSPQIILKSPQPVSVSSIEVSSISGVPVFTLAQYQALSTLAA